MGKDDSSTKKRRKLASTASTGETKQTITPEELYKKAVLFEETEAQSRPTDQDASLFRKYCDDIRQLFTDIAKLKNENTKEAADLINAKRVEASLIIVVLKKLNRIEKFRMKTGRDALHKEKQRVDSTHLQLQNLLYEAEHLNKEVTKCLQFRSKDEEIDLIPVEDFYAEAPAELTREETTTQDEHQLQLARLEWELRKRRELASACSELEGSKEQVAAAIAAARSRLDGLAPHLADILKATKPLQECLALNIDKKKDEAKAADLLPVPLFLLYANSAAYADAFGTDKLSVAISGDEDEARRIEQHKQVEDTTLFNDSDSDREVNEEEQSKKKRHHRSSKFTKEEKAEAKRKEALKRHPLAVQLSIRLKDGTILNLIFYYLLKLEIITVKCTITVERAVTGVSAADVLLGANVLNSVYPGDKGLDSPHLMTSYILKVAGISSSFTELVSEIGRPYLWAQRVCGLDFTTKMAVPQGNKVAKITPSPDLSTTSVQSIVSVLKNRLKSRVDLMRELQDLECGKISSRVEPYPIRLSGSLTQWQSIGWPEYSQTASTKKFISKSIVDSEDMLYRAIITRQSAKLVALVALKSEYPKVAPIFSLMLHWNGTHHAGTNDDIRDIERIINTGSSNEAESVTLSSQMAQLLTCLDILLEALGSSEFPPDKVMFRLVRGRNRSKPFKFLKQGSGVFTQY